MLLRSSSTPILGSLHPSFSDNPNTTPHLETTGAGKNPHAPSHHNHNKLSFHQTGAMNLSSFSCNSSPISPSITAGSGFRRAQSEGNLEGLASASCGNLDELGDLKPLPRPSRRPTYPVLQTIPSFSFYGSSSRCEEEDSDEDENEDGEGTEENGALVERSDLEIGEGFSTFGRGKIDFLKPKMGSVEEMGFMNGFGKFNCQYKEGQTHSQMYLAKGLGVGGGDSGGGNFTLQDFGNGNDDGDSPEIEAHYKRMVEENPLEPLFLRNYAEFLYNSKGDLQKAEEYYSRAILADPTDGEILSQYAKLTWELHHDEDRTSSYFERAVQAAPEDSHVHAAYASFLWEAEEDGEVEDVAAKDTSALPLLYHNRAMASANA